MSRSIAVAALLLSLTSTPCRGSGIPEPGFTMYGLVRAELNGSLVRLTSGTLTWTIVPAGGGDPVVVETDLEDVAGQFSYVLEVPFETIVSPLTLSSNVLELTQAPSAYDRSAVQLEGEDATIAAPAGGSFSYSASSRAAIERVDLYVGVVFTDSDNDGLPDSFELRYWGEEQSPHTGSEDADMDGFTNLQEFLAGTDPTLASSQLYVVDARMLENGSMVIDWASASNRSYRIQRSEDLLNNFAPLVSGLSSTPPLNSYTDTTANATHHFYHVEVE